MKKIKTISILFSILFGLNANAQFSKGNWLVEGNIGDFTFSNYKSDYSTPTTSSLSTSKGFSLNINPKAGYFVSNNFVTGLSLNVYLYNYKGDYNNAVGLKVSDYDSSGSQLTASPFLRYYFSGTEKIHFYAQADAGYSINLSDKYKQTSYNATTGAITSTYVENALKLESGFSANGLVGLNYFMSKNVALNTAIGYNYSKKSNSSNSTVTTSGVSTTSPDSSYTYTSGGISWTAGFTMILD